MPAIVLKWLPLVFQNKGSPQSIIQRPPAWCLMQDSGMVGNGGKKEERSLKSSFYCEYHLSTVEHSCVSAAYVEISVLNWVTVPPIETISVLWYHPLKDMVKIKCFFDSKNTYVNCKISILRNNHKWMSMAATDCIILMKCIYLLNVTKHPVGMQQPSVLLFLTQQHMTQHISYWERLCRLADV